MTTQEKMNLLEVIDYFSMRKNKQASNVKWRQVRSLILPGGNTFWQLFSKFEDYDTRYEPSMTQLNDVMEGIDTLIFFTNNK